MASGAHLRVCCSGAPLQPSLFAQDMGLRNELLAGAVDALLGTALVQPAVAVQVAADRLWGLMGEQAGEFVHRCASPLDLCEICGNRL